MKEVPLMPENEPNLLREIAKAQLLSPPPPDNGKILIEIATGAIACLAMVGREVTAAQATDAAWAVVHRHGSEQVTAFGFVELVQETRDLLDEVRDEG